MPWIPATCFLPGFWLERVPAPLSQTYPSGLGLCIFEVPELNFHFLFFNNRYVCVCVCVCARVRVCVLVAQSCPTLGPHGPRQALLSIEFSRQNYWSG